MRRREWRCAPSTSTSTSDLDPDPDPDPANDRRERSERRREAPWRRPKHRGTIEIHTSDRLLSNMAMNVDEGIRRWWAAVKQGPESYFTQRWDAQLLALGPEALERTLDCIDGKAKVDIARQGYMEHRDLGDWEEVAVIACARADVGRVLGLVKARGWEDLKIAHYLGGVPAPPLLPYLLAAMASKHELQRLAAVNHLGAYRDPRATAALIRALKDRASLVRFCAIERLGDAGDQNAIEPLHRFAREASLSKRFFSLAACAKAAVRKIRTAARGSSQTRASTKKPKTKAARS
jgi:HEAT repeat protein